MAFSRKRPRDQEHRPCHEDLQNRETGDAETRMTAMVPTKKSHNGMKSRFIMRPTSARVRGRS